MISHKQISTSLNTYGLCEAYFDFLLYHGLEYMDDIPADELLFHLESDGQSEMTEWLTRFIRLWAYACDAEYTLGHAIQPYHGWHPDQTNPIV